MSSARSFSFAYSSHPTPPSELPRMLPNTSRPHGSYLASTGSTQPGYTSYRTSPRSAAWPSSMAPTFMLRVPGTIAPPSPVPPHS